MKDVDDEDNGEGDGDDNDENNREQRFRFLTGATTYHEGGLDSVDDHSLPD
jgi:hypothetical protein